MSSGDCSHMLFRTGRWLSEHDPFSVRLWFWSAVAATPVAVVFAVIWAPGFWSAGLGCESPALGERVFTVAGQWPRLQWEVSQFVQRGFVEFAKQYCVTVEMFAVLGFGSSAALALAAALAAFFLGHGLSRGTLVMNVAWLLVLLFVAGALFSMSWFPPGAVFGISSTHAKSHLVAGKLAFAYHAVVISAMSAMVSGSLLILAKLMREWLGMLLRGISRGNHD